MTRGPTNLIDREAATARVRGSSAYLQKATESKGKKMRKIHRMAAGAAMAVSAVTLLMIAIGRSASSHCQLLSAKSRCQLLPVLPRQRLQLYHHGAVPSDGIRTWS